MRLIWIQSKSEWQCNKVLKKGVSPKQEPEKAPEPEVTPEGLKQEGAPDKQFLDLATKLLTQSVGSQSPQPLVQAMLLQQLFAQQNNQRKVPEKPQKRRSKTCARKRWKKGTEAED